MRSGGGVPGAHDMAPAERRRGVWRRWSKSSVSGCCQPGIPFVTLVTCDGPSPGDDPTRYREENPLTTAPKIDNLDLATTAREMADNAPAGSLGHAAATSVAITCATTRGLPEARAVLDGITPSDVRLAAVELFGRLTSGRHR